MKIDQRPTTDVALLAGRVPYHPNLYVIGPFAERLSFASQQRRALSLVCAIQAELEAAGEKHGLEGKRVCIIGAGLAGLTCSLGLLAHKADTWILEASDRPMAHMLDVGHRDIHPTINFWPREEIALTTELPFLNWYQDNCGTILQDLLAEWEQIAYAQPNFRELKGGCRVSAIRWNGRGWDIDATNPPEDQDFDIVILATGFGPERDLAETGTPGYWNEQDDLIDEIRKKNKPIVNHYVVSGTGDGGLIEALRLLFNDFRAGKIASRTKNIIDDKTLSGSVRYIEGDMKSAVFDDVLHQDFPLSDEDKDKIALRIWEQYTKVEKLPASRLLEALREDRTPVRVGLIGRRPTPTEYSSSPYHRLLIMISIRMGWLEYYQVDRGGVTDSVCALPEEDYSLARRLSLRRKRLEFQPKRKISGDGSKFIYDENPSRCEWDACFYLARHGTISPLEAMFKIPPIALPKPADQLVEFVRRRQALYADQDWITMAQASQMAKALGQTDPADPIKWARFHLHRAIPFFETRFGLVAEVDRPSGKGPRFKLTTEGAAPWDESKWEPVPNSFFGIPVEPDVDKLPTTPHRSGHGR